MARRDGPALLLAGLTAFIFALLIAPTTCISKGALTDAKVQELVSLRAQSKDGIIPINTKLFKKYALAEDRKYSLVIFLSADYLFDDPRLQLRKKYKEYSFAAQAFNKGPDADKVFFTLLKFEEAEQLFRQLGVQSLPHVLYWGPGQERRSSGALNVKDSDTMSGANGPREWVAEEYVTFVSDRANVVFEPIDRPSLVKSPAFPFIALLTLATLATLAWRVYQSPLLRIKGLWLAGALVVFWFSSSGGMYNIIRGMPMYYINKEGQVQFWLPGRGSQLGAEGFTMGTIYLMASVSMSAITYKIPRIRDPQRRSLLAAIALLVGSWLVFQAFSLYKWKAGYWLNIYLP